MQRHKDYLRLLSNFQTTLFVHICLITFHIVKGCQQPPKHMEIEAKIMIYSALVPCQKFYTRWIHAFVCVMTLLTDKAAQVINLWGNCPKS